MTKWWTRKPWHWHYESVTIHSKYWPEYKALLPVVVVRRLGFISYHLIRLIHGDEALKEMANKGLNVREF